MSLTKRFLLLASYLSLALLASAVDSWTPPLSTQGRYIVDANGNRFKLKSGNWHGASGTYSGSGDINDDASHHASENAHTMPLGLQYVPIDTIIDRFDAAGVNSIRLPFSNEMIHDTTIVNDAYVAANPQFKGLTSLQVYDKVVEALTAKGFAVVLNNHTNKSKWCCGVSDGNERWDESQAESAWSDDWLFMVKRYKNNPRVAAADLYNEVRRDITTDPSWGSGSEDWFKSSQAAGDRILLEANPDILIIVEGINWTGIPVDGFAHDRPTLVPAGNLSHTLVKPNKLVYSAHFYAYTGPRHSGATGIGETTDPRYRDLSVDDLHSEMRRQATYVALDTDKHYTAPVWLSEFGCGRGDSGTADGNWFLNFVDYIVDNDIDFALWPLMGYLNNGSGNNWALHNWDLAKNAFTPFSEDFRWPAWQKLTSNTKELKGNVARTARWDMLNMDSTDFVQSVTVRNNDWDNGARKAVCPDGTRLIGMSNAAPSRGLCSDVNFFDLSTSPSTSGVWGEGNVTNDWAGGFTKLECPADQFVVGYSVRSNTMSGVLCAKLPSGKHLTSGNGRTVWFNQHDATSQDAGDWATGHYKGSCSANELVTGYAFRNIANFGAAAALYCRTWA